MSTLKPQRLPVRIDVRTSTESGVDSEKPRHSKGAESKVQYLDLQLVLVCFVNLRINITLTLTAMKNLYNSVTSTYVAALTNSHIVQMSALHQISRRLRLLYPMSNAVHSITPRTCPKLDRLIDINKNPVNELLRLRCG